MSFYNENGTLTREACELLFPQGPVEKKYVLDACCGSRMFYYEKQSPHVLFMDNREGDFQLSNGKEVKVHPDVVASFEDMPFAGESFQVVVFDPPHLRNPGPEADMTKTYGRLVRGWQDVIRNGFRECFRVLKPHGVLLFKWCETDIKLATVLELAPYRPLLGTRTKVQTFFILFLKEEIYEK
jgi:SAM-dependent methyltransferase